MALAGQARCAAIILNALDHRPQSRTDWLERQTSKLAGLGFDVVELDLRNHFSSTAQLRQVLSDVDLVWINGGNAFTARSPSMKSPAFPIEH